MLNRTCLEQHNLNPSFLLEVVVSISLHYANHIYSFLTSRLDANVIFTEK